MKIIVTGGAGFIGSAVIRHIINHTNNEVLNIDKLTYAGNLESLESIADSERYQFSQTDICDRIALDQIFESFQPDAVMHLAAESHVDRSITGSAAFIETNIIGTYQLLEATRHYWNGLNQNKKQAFRFHHISTDEVYGDLEGTDDLFLETTPYAPSSPYSASKASSDHLVRAWHRTYGLPTMITNCSNNYGPYHFPEKLIPLIIKNILEGKNLPVYGDGKQVRDWLYVEDHCKGIDMVINGGKLGEAYNIGGFNEETNINIVKLTIDTVRKLIVDSGELKVKDQYKNVVKCPLEKINYDLITHVQDRLGHDARYAIDPAKTVKELGFYPETPFTVGIEKTIKWYLDNQEWVNEVVSGDYQKYYAEMYGKK